MNEKKLLAIRSLVAHAGSEYSLDGTRARYRGVVVAFLDTKGKAHTLRINDTGTAGAMPVSVFQSHFRGIVKNVS